MQYAVAIRRAWHRRCTFLCVMMPVKSAPRRRETSRQTKTVLEGLARLSPTRSCAPSCASTERLSLPRIPSLAISYCNACWCILLCLRLLKCLRVCVCVYVCAGMMPCRCSAADAVPLQCCRCRAAAVLQCCSAAAFRQTPPCVLLSTILASFAFSPSHSWIFLFC